MNTPTRDYRYLFAVAFVHIAMLGTGGVSFTHIIDVSDRLGLGWEKWTVPFLIDGFAYLGKLGRAAHYADRTRNAGLAMMTGAGVLSLACNVYAGHNLGQRLYGVLLVCAFIAAEWYSEKLRGARTVTASTGRKLTPEQSAARTAKANATREANRLAKMTPAEKAKQTKQRNRIAAQVDELEKMAAGFVPADAPTSPAMA